MALQLTGAISLDDVNVELFKSLGTTTSLNDADVRWLAEHEIAESIISLDMLYGKSNRVAYTYTISADALNVGINPSIVPGYIAGLRDITVVVNSGIVVGSTSTGVPALTVSGLSAGDTLIIQNNGTIVGKGGTGSNGVGGVGGVGFSTNFATTITNNGRIAGGGGGGGGSAAYSYMISGYPPAYPYVPAYGGGGGAGRNVGTPGTGGANGTLLAGGAGGTGSGAGGAVGAAGGSGRNSGGGGGGAATSGNSYITWLVTGTRNGALN